MSTTLGGPLRPLVNLDLVRWHLAASAVFFAVSLLAGLAYAFQFNNLYPFAGVEWLSPGRVRMVHTNAAAYGFIANAFIAGLLFAIPRLTRRPILSDRLGWLVFAAWQLVLVLIEPEEPLGVHHLRGLQADPAELAHDLPVGIVRETGHRGLEHGRIDD